MYPAIKTDAISESKAIEIVGKDNVEAVKGVNCYFSGRLIDDIYNVDEMSASIDCQDVNGDDVTLCINYLIDKDSLNDCDDLGTLDYSSYTFDIF